jgi:hypothetical protein
MALLGSARRDRSFIHLDNPWGSDSRAYNKEQKTRSSFNSRSLISDQIVSYAKWMPSTISRACGEPPLDQQCITCVPACSVCTHSKPATIRAQNRVVGKYFKNENQDSFASLSTTPSLYTQPTSSHYINTLRRIIYYISQLRHSRSCLTLGFL